MDHESEINIYTIQLYKFTVDLRSPCLKPTLIIIYIDFCHLTSHYYNQHNQQSWQELYSLLLLVWLCNQRRIPQHSQPCELSSPPGASLCTPDCNPARCRHWYCCWRWWKILYGCCSYLN